jgi:molecular chaperone DnaJ
MAYTVMNDPEMRKMHQRTGEIPNTVDIPQSLEKSLQNAGIRNLAKGFLSNFQKSRPRRGRDLIQTVHLSVRELLNGATRIFDVKRHEQCVDCLGSGSASDPAPVRCHVCDGVGTIGWRKVRSVGIQCPFCEGLGVIIVSPCTSCAGHGQIENKNPFRVTFPPGTPEGHRTVVTGEGERGQEGGRHGDLVFVARIDPECGFQRVGEDLHVQASLDSQNTLISIEHPEGPVEVTVPNKGNVDMVVVKGYGLPSFGEPTRRGDMKVQIRTKNEVGG